MKYASFKDLPVCKAAIDMAIGVYNWTSEPTWTRHRSLRDQFERALVTISNNIAGTG